MAEQTFIPKAGQVDYTHIRYCPVINCVLEYQKSILLVQRSAELRLYPGYWNGISGFLDDHKSVEEKVYEELSEELHMPADSVLAIHRGRVLVQEAPDYGRPGLCFQCGLP